MYELNATLAGDYESVLETVKAVLMEEKLGIVSEVNVQQVFKAKIDKEIPPYRIFGACNPMLAADVLEAEPNAGTLLPCNFVLYEKEPGVIVVSFMDPETVLGLAATDVVKKVGVQAKDKILRVLDKLNAN